MEECLKKRFLPFIKKHDRPTIFWPDLATIHYFKKALEWCKQNDVKLVPKEANPQNCPESANYWSIIKGILLKSMK